MTTPIRYTYRRTEKLKSRKQIDLLFKEGKSMQVNPIRVIYQFHQAQHPLQAAVTVSSRHFKRAVDRNRIKRLMREAYRLQKHSLLETLQNKQHSLVLFFTYTGRELPAFEMIYEGMSKAIKKINEVIDAKH